MNEIIAAIVGALLAGPAGYLIERVLSRPRISINYARLEYEDIIALSPELHLKLIGLESFIQWMDSLVPWKFNQCVQANYYSRDEIRVFFDLGTAYLELQKANSESIHGHISKMEKATGDEAKRLLAEYIVDYKQVFDKQISQDFPQDPIGALARLKDHFGGLVENIDNQAIPLVKRVLDECEQQLSRDRGTSDRLIVRVGVGNRGIQDGILESKASMDAVGNIFELPIKLNRRPWQTGVEDDGAFDSTYIRLPARSFKVLDFQIDENLNAKAHVDKLIRESQRGSGTLAKFFAHGFGKKNLVSIKFNAELPGKNRS
jgi:hypothetical protein